MSRLNRRTLLALPGISYLLSKVSAFAEAVPSVKNTEWTQYAGDLANTRYSTLDQINASNFDDLEVAWQFKTDSLGAHPEYKFEGTPLLANGIIYVTAGSRRDVVALDGATGELLWVHREDEGERAARSSRSLSGRGLAYWTDGTQGRILYVTIGYRLVALDARTGAPIAGFGRDGVVDLKLDDDQVMDLVNGDVGLHSTPVVTKDIVIIGAAHAGGNAPKTHANVKGYVRGFDVRTGRRLWIFHTVPQPGEFGFDTWLNHSTAQIGNTGVWCQISVDEALGLAYLGVELPTGDESGQYRPGPGLFGESVVAVDVQTGKRRWHYQTIHHGLWDRDIPCAPILVDIPVNGTVVKALAQPTKQAWLYVLNRETGKPIWPILERPAPKGDVPGEWYSPTQPFVTTPPAYDVQGVSPEVLIDFTPELHAKALSLISHYKTGPLYSPPSVSSADGTWGTLVAPHMLGGTNWPGGAYDPETQLIYVHSRTQVDVCALIPNTDKTRSDFDYVEGLATLPAPRPDGLRPGVLTVEGLPLLKPPYGRLTAIDLKHGAIAWHVPHGETPDEVRNHPALKGLKIPRTGQVGIVGPLATKTLLICGDPEITTDASGTRGAMLRAYDKATGEERGAVPMPASQSGAPMTYMLGGRQYIVLAVSGGTYSGALMAYRLPLA
jgi:quinoprotein glucose dehydrogenase